MEFSCSCAPGWTSQFCDSEINECESAPCQNGGVCVDKIASYACACPMGFTGLNCEEEILKCENSPCKNNALCLMEEGVPVCYCVPDYHGERCELQYDECQLGPRCLNGGVCIDGIDSFSCSCPPQLTGILCECLMLGNDDVDCNYTSPTKYPPPTQRTSTVESASSTGFVYPETTIYSTVPTTIQFTTPDGEAFQSKTSTRSRYSPTTFQGVDTHTFRSSTAGSEFHHSTLSPSSHTHPYTDEGNLIDDDNENEYTRFATRPTPGARTTHTTPFNIYTTYEPTKPVPTDAPDHITHFFTEFPRHTTSTPTSTGSNTEDGFTSTVESIITTTFKVDTTQVDVHTTEHSKTTTTETMTTTEEILTTPMTTPEHSTTSTRHTEPATTTIKSTEQEEQEPEGEIPEISNNIDCDGECKNGGTCSLSNGNPKVNNTFLLFHFIITTQLNVLMSFFNSLPYIQHTHTYLCNFTN